MRTKVADYIDKAIEDSKKDVDEEAASAENIVAQQVRPSLKLVNVLKS